MNQESKKQLEILLQKLASEYNFEICSLNIKSNQSPIIIEITIRKTNREDISLDDCSRFNTPVFNKIENSILQFHGDEDESFCKQFNQSFWKTIRVKNSQSLEKVNNFPSADAILLETFSNDAYGGTGKVFDWTLLEKISLHEKFIIAGGINPDNIMQAVNLNPWCIDVNSGVESSLALKDKTLIDQVIKIFKNG